MSKINFSVKNRGPSDASHVVVTLNGIEEVQLSEIAVGKGVVKEGRWYVGDLDIGESVDFDATATVPDDVPSVSIKAHVHAATADYNTTNNVIEIIVMHDAQPEPTRMSDLWVREYEGDGIVKPPNFDTNIPE